MKSQKIISAVFAVLLVGSFAANSYIENAQRNAPAMEGDLIFPNFNADKVERIVIHRPGSITDDGQPQTIELIRDEANLDVWRMSQPFAATAASDAKGSLPVSSFLTSTFLGDIETMMIGATLDASQISPEELSVIEDSSIDVKMTMKDRPPIEFSLSNKSTGERQSLYFRFPSDRRFFLVPVNPFGSFMVDARAYLDPRLFPLTIRDIETIRIVSYSAGDDIPTFVISIFRFRDPAGEVKGWLIQNIAGKDGLEPPRALHNENAVKFIEGEFIGLLLADRRFSERTNPWIPPDSEPNGRRGGDYEFPDLFLDISAYPSDPEKSAIRYYLRLHPDDKGQASMLYGVSPRLSTDRDADSTNSIMNASTIIDSVLDPSLEVIAIRKDRIERLTRETVKLLDGAKQMN